MSDFKQFSPQAMKKHEEERVKQNQKSAVDEIESALINLMARNLRSEGGRLSISEDNILFKQIGWVEKKLSGLGWKVEITSRDVETVSRRWIFFTKSTFQKVHTVVCRS